MPNPGSTLEKRARPKQKMMTRSHVGSNQKMTRSHEGGKLKSRKDNINVNRSKHQYSIRN